MSDRAQEETIRADERRRIAELLEEHAETIGGFALDSSHAVRLVAFMLELRLPPTTTTT